MENTYLIAEHLIRITSLYEMVHSFCRDYRVGEAESGLEPDFIVSTTQSDIDAEREKSAREEQIEGLAPRYFSDAYLETLAVYRQISEHMLNYDTFLFHGSALAVDGNAYLFTAKSGTGKSTHSRLWRELLGNRVVMVNDDKPLIHVKEDGQAIVYGTPWCGKHRLNTNIAVPLKAICILERSQENHIRQLTKPESYPMLLQQAYRPADPAALSKTLQLIDRMNIRLYRLGCNMDISAAELSYNTIKEDQT